MADAKEGGEPHKEQAPADAQVHSEELTGKSEDTQKALSEHPATDADAKADPHADAAHAGSHDSHGHDAHGHDSHGHDSHGHDSHDSHGHGAVPADAIPENSVWDSMLPGLALLVGLALAGLIVFWCGLKPAAVAEGEGAEGHSVEHAAPAEH
ncbi:MAG TPA: hypothetical protein V6C76_11225 [Drouetiella sp.]